ncbi:hypothetical protein RHSIM_Rhsim12G0102900 [Rhododendron simsii]|uniref:AAA+ ATPase domain-containing protein n=1 Tax=Rhododendron simsii TaxID=118357 RepID=A0A834L8J2_RHOSS|nr:hypothetical protein RHSIM_Rhsim12G0102900 [Rhododendron simsii]
MPSTTSVLSTYTTFAASAMLVKTVLNEVQNLTNQFIPQQLREKILAKFEGLMGNSSSQMTLVIDEKNGLSINEMFEASEIYLRTKISPSVLRLKVSKAPRDKTFSITINNGEKIIDTFEDIEVIWQMICTETQKTTSDYDGYLNSEKMSKTIKEEDKVLKLQPLGHYHENVNLNHPSTFDTLAMDPTLKKEIMDDLDRFGKRRTFYKRVGKAWKRGYLLYGPPGTGKSSLIAAMANHLKFDIYDVELTSLQSNSELRRLLVSTANRSILVIEDIDCSSDLQNRQAGGHNEGNSEVTLSGLLNFIDGLWSCCGDERIIVFTTNHKDRLDPALLRPGRMDMHIHMSYCTPGGFKILALNYLGLTNHFMFTEIEKLITEVEATPAEIAEELMKSEEPEVALKGLIKYLHLKKIEHVKANIEGEKDIGAEEEESQEIKVEPETKGRRTNKRNARRGRMRR